MVVGAFPKAKNCVACNSNVLLARHQREIKTLGEFRRRFLNAFVNRGVPNQVNDVESAEKPPGCFQIQIPPPGDELPGSAQAGIKIDKNKAAVQQIAVQKGIFEHIRVAEILKNLLGGFLLRHNELCLTQNFLPRCEGIETAGEFQKKKKARENFPNLQEY